VRIRTDHPVTKESKIEKPYPLYGRMHAPGEK
jgi:hypothetical protein